MRGKEQNVGYGTLKLDLAFFENIFFLETKIFNPKQQYKHKRVN